MPCVLRPNRFLFRKDIEPRCLYCARSVPLDAEHVACRRRGVVPTSYACRAFRYDPLRRIPPKPAIIRGHFSDEDFTLEEPEE